MWNGYKFLGSNEKTLIHYNTLPKIFIAQALDPENISSYRNLKVEGLCICKYVKDLNEQMILNYAVALNRCTLIRGRQRE